MAISPSVEPATPPAPPLKAPKRRNGWTGGRIIAVVIGCVIGLVSLGLLATGGWVTWLTTQRDAGGYLTASAHVLATDGYVVTSDDVGELATKVPQALIGTIRIRATERDPSSAVFIGVAPKTAVDSYLSGVDRHVVTGWFPFKTENVQFNGTAPTSPPTDVQIWTDAVSGTGTQTLTWHPASGNWTVVVMHADASPRVSVIADIGATGPDLGWVAVALFLVGLLLLAVAVVLVVVPVVRASR